MTKQVKLTSDLFNGVCVVNSFNEITEFFDDEDDFFNSLNSQSENEIYGCIVSFEMLHKIYDVYGVHGYWEVLNAN